MKHIRTKICGITRLDDATAAVGFGADAIGLNFYSKSKRFIDVDAAAEISLVHAADIATFGVFVNASVTEITFTATNARLSHVQLHGDEQPEIVERLRRVLPGVEIARAIRIMDSDMARAQAEIDAWSGVGIDVLLLDAAAPGEFGGTGHRLDWNQVATLDLPANWLLAGGLTADNVKDAIAAARPGGVDVASGVETSPGVKDKSMMRQFVERANRNFEG